METGNKEVAGTVAAYAVAIVALFVASLLISSTETKYVILKGLMFVLSVSLIPRAAGSVLGRYKMKLPSFILNIAVFWSLLIFLALYAVLLGVLNGAEIPYVFPLFLLGESIILLYAGSRGLNRGLLYYSGTVVKGAGIALLLTAFGAFVYAYVPFRPFSYFFVPLVIFYFFDGFTPYMMKSKNEAVSNLGRYVIKSGDRLPTTAAGIGALLVAYAYPKAGYLNDILLSAVVIVTALVIIAVVWRIYATTSERVHKLSDEVFTKHKKSMTVFSDTSLDFVTDSVNEFRVSGKKEKLIIALTMILTAAGHTLEECNVVLRSLILYTAPDPLIYKKMSVRLRVSHDVGIRDGIIKEILKEMKHIGVEN